MSMTDGCDETRGGSTSPFRRVRAALLPLFACSRLLFTGRTKENYAGEGHEMMCRFRERRPAMPFAKRRLLRRNVNFADRFRPIA
jgi:hypothetical protein